MNKRLLEYIKLSRNLRVKRINKQREDLAQVEVQRTKRVTWAMW